MIIEPQPASAIEPQPASARAALPDRPQTRVRLEEFRLRWVLQTNWYATEPNIAGDLGLTTTTEAKAA